MPQSGITETPSDISRLWEVHKKNSKFRVSEIPLDIASYIATWDLAIISRVKYKNRFSLVLIIIYGSLLALSVIGIIVLLCFFIGMF